MKDLPLVSIIIPCFNQGQYLQQALDSALSQTYGNSEIIIVNDGSTDVATIKLFNEIENRQIRNVKVLHQKNQGLAMTRNNGINISKGQFVLPLDSDDYIHKDYLKETMNVAVKNNKTGAVTTYIQAFGGSKEMWETKRTNLIEMLVKDFVCGNSLIRRAAFQEVKNKNGYGYNPNMKEGYEDWDFWVSLLEVNKWEIECVQKPLFYYRVKPNSMYTEARKKHLDLYQRILVNHKESFRKYYKEVITGHLINYSDLMAFNDDLKSKYDALKKDTTDPLWLIKRFVKTLTGTIKA